MPLTVPLAEWLEGHAGKWGVAGSIRGGGIHYHFELFASALKIVSAHPTYPNF